MICAIHQPQYLPWLGYFDKMARADVFVLLDNVQFKKNEWQNRNRIRIPHGWQWVTVPVLHDHGQLISEVAINPAVDWRAQHVRAIELNYARAPFFREYWPRLSPVYGRPWRSLGDLNVAIVRSLADILGIKTRIILASEFSVVSEKTQRLVDICRHVGCDTYLAGSGCADYMDLELVRAAGVNLEVQTYAHPVYPQFWDTDGAGFQPFMSVVDLLLNCGPSSLGVLRGIIKK